MDTRYELSDYLNRPGKTQVSLAKAVGLTQGAVFQMLRSDRSIFVIEREDGSLALEEVKTIGAV
jgi:predicted transcriptional regulator